MAIHPVLTWGDPRLKRNSEDVGAWSPELDQLVADMFETAIAEEGVGLAAPQIGLNINPAVHHPDAGEDPAPKTALTPPGTPPAGGRPPGAQRKTAPRMDPTPNELSPRRRSPRTSIRFTRCSSSVMSAARSTRACAPASLTSLTPTARGWLVAR